MKVLNLPIIKGKSSKSPRILSMDEYFKFIQFNLKQTFDKKSYLKWKRLMVVNVAFSLK